jgi:hypothetical protein
MECCACVAPCIEREGGPDAGILRCNHVGSGCLQVGNKSASELTRIMSSDPAISEVVCWNPTSTFKALAFGPAATRQRARTILEAIPTWNSQPSAVSSACI